VRWRPVSASPEPSILGAGEAKRNFTYVSVSPIVAVEVQSAETGVRHRHWATSSMLSSGTNKSAAAPNRLQIGLPRVFNS
jgi:hypothetical protein